MHKAPVQIVGSDRYTEEDARRGKHLRMRAVMESREKGQRRKAVGILILLAIVALILFLFR